MKLSIGVIFGGNSIEHELSILTAIQAMDNIDKERYEVVPIYITKDLTIYTGGMLRYIDSYKDFRLIERYAVKVHLVNKKGKFILQKAKGLKNDYKEIHLAFPMVHGKNTEDGSIVGYLKTLGIPFVGSDIYASSLCQDKRLTKEILSLNKFPVIDYVHFTDTEYKIDKEDIFKEIDKLSYPLIIKPARLGSSIGLEIIKRKEELESSIEKVMSYDSHILIEEYIKDKKEFNVAILKSKDKFIDSTVEEIERDGFGNYYDKYHKDEDSDDTFKRIYPADINKTLTEEICKTAKRAYKCLSLNGVARIDFLYDTKNEKLYINEINTIPNFFSHHLFEEKNIDYRELLGIMIKEAIDEIHKNVEKHTKNDDEMFKKVTSKDVRNMK